ncbi:MAG: hypothetical protein WHS82_07785 [Candidatus Methanosuratincola sp.]
MDRAFTTIILMASLLAAGGLYATASATFWEGAGLAMAERAVDGMAFQMAAVVAEAACEAAQSGTAVRVHIVLTEVALVEASGNRIAVITSFKGRLLNASVSLAGGIEIQPSKVSASSFIVTAFPNGTSIILGQRGEGI